MMLRKTSSGIELDIRVIPRSRKTTIDGVRGDAVLIRLSAPPVDGAANEALVDFFANRLGIAKRAVRIVAGGRGQRKTVALDGVTEQTLREKLGLQ